MRGDNEVLDKGPYNHNGSPPHAWGQRLRRYPDVPPDRFTPTCVGTTAGSCRRTGPSAVHPHMRGDNIPCRTRILTDLGSPPHAWGQPATAGIFTELPRFTPTCVGTTAGLTRTTQLPSVHPHMRGDNLLCPPFPKCPRGSPPHAWGQRIVDHYQLDLARFTPTRVGITRSSPCRSR